MSNGKVYLIGVGPGDPDLITIKGLKVLEQADVVIYDYLVDKNVLINTKQEAELICADNLGRERYNNGFSKRQDLINKLIVKKAKEGRKVVRLKNGDPFVFGRASEEMEALTRNKIDYAVVPGVIAANAAACFSGIPLTIRGISSSVVITTGHEATEKNAGAVDWDIISRIDTIVLYMAVENLGKIINTMFQKGKKHSTPIAVISNVSKISQKLVIGTLQDILDKVKSKDILAPAIVIIGEVVRKEKIFNWFRKTKKILFTGISTEKFFEKGIIFHLPLIEIKPLENYSELDNWIEKLCQPVSQKLSANGYKSSIDWIVFSSRFGVIYFFQRLFKLGFDTRNLMGIKIASIGNSTATKLKEYGIIANLVPKKESSAGLLTEFKKINVKGKSIFLPRSDIADKGLTEGLKKQEAFVYPCIAYRNIMTGNLPELDFNIFDEIIFTSPSIVRNFIKRYKKIPKNMKIRCIGDVTLKEAKRCRLLD